jgi:hypothetical protein
MFLESKLEVKTTQSLKYTIIQRDVIQLEIYIHLSRETASSEG